MGEREKERERVQYKICTNNELLWRMFNELFFLMLTSLFAYTVNFFFSLLYTSQIIFT